MKLTSLQKKMLHSTLVSLFGSMADVGIQLTSGSLNLTRTVAVGLILGIVSRAAGAALAWLATAETPTKE
jgi:hypothetical protein